MGSLRGSGAVLDSAPSSGLGRPSRTAGSAVLHLSLLFLVSQGKGCRQHLPSERGSEKAFSFPGLISKPREPLSCTDPVLVLDEVGGRDYILKVI